MSEIKKKKKKTRSNCSDSSSSNNNSSSNSSNSQSTSDDKTSKLCYFSALDYIVLASTLAIALGEELSTNDINILSTFFAVLSDELALIGSVDACTTGSTDVFVPPVPDVAMTTSQDKVKTDSKNKNMKKKK